MVLAGCLARACMDDGTVPARFRDGSGTAPGRLMTRYMTRHEVAFHGYPHPMPPPWCLLPERGQAQSEFS